jgi:hypothetical protein
MATLKRVRTGSGQAEDEARMLRLLLEVREQMHKMDAKMDARLERIGAHVERIDARVCRMERAWPLHTHAAAASPASDAPEPLRVAVRPPVMRLLDLPAELLVAIAARLAEDNDLAFALACCSRWRASSRAAVGARGWVPVGLVHVP